MSRMRAGLLLVVTLLHGCAGWSSWEDSQPVRPQRPVGPGDYMVRRGDTLYSIAFRNNLDYHDLARWNGIGTDYLIVPGQVLRLRGPASAAPRQPVRDSGPVAASPPPPAPSVVLPPPQSATPAPTGSGDWVWPTAGSVARGFGQQGSKGLDLSGRDGQPVVAAAAGKVVYSGNALKGYGELIIIKHDNDLLSAYGYNHSRYVKEGDVVTAGQPIARMGRGPENKPMLHFEIRRAGKPIDPLRQLPKQPS